MSKKMLIFHILAPINVDPVPTPQYPGPGTSPGTRDPGLSPGPADTPKSLESDLKRIHASA